MSTGSAVAGSPRKSWWSAFFQGLQKMGRSLIPRFLAGDPTAGQFQAGSFPIMMFALPAAALAIAHTATPHRRKEVGGLMLSVALTSFVTGITEPIEYSFLFVAPLLFAIHALLTGVSMALCWTLGIKDGFSFSAGLTDYVINWNLATKPMERDNIK